MKTTLFSLNFFINYNQHFLIYPTNCPEAICSEHLYGVIRDSEETLCSYLLLDLLRQPDLLTISVENVVIFR